MKIISICIVLFLFVSTALPQKNSVRTISDYLEKLPKKYITYSDNFDASSESSKTVIDNENGYAAFIDTSSDPSETFFEMGLFNSQNGEPTLVISNHKKNDVCSIYETFFLQKKGDEWIDVKSEVAPVLELSMFFSNPVYAKKYKEMKELYGDRFGRFYYQYVLPKKGTRIKVDPLFCEWDEPATSPAPPSAPQSVPASEDDEILNSAEAIYLEWSKNKGKFEVVNKN